MTLPYNDPAYRRRFADPARRPSNQLEYPFERDTLRTVQALNDWLDEEEARQRLRGVGAGEPGE